MIEHVDETQLAEDTNPNGTAGYLLGENYLHDLVVLGGCCWFLYGLLRSHHPNASAESGYYEGSVCALLVLQYCGSS